MREANYQLWLHHEDLEFSERVTGKAAQNKVFLIDWQRLFGKKTYEYGGFGDLPSDPLNGNLTGNISALGIGAQGENNLSAVDVVLNGVIGLTTASRVEQMAMYDLIRKNPGYDIVMFPTFQTHKKWYVIGSNTEVICTAKLGKLKASNKLMPISVFKKLKNLKNVSQNLSLYYLVFLNYLYEKFVVGNNYNKQIKFMLFFYKNCNNVKIRLLILFLFVSYSSFSQFSEIFNIPKSVEKPEWVKLANWDKPNANQIDSLLNIYGKDSKKEKFESKEIDNDQDEEPYLMAYLRWIKRNKLQIETNGEIKVEKKYFLDFYKNYSTKNSRKSNITGLANWKIVGPVTTTTELTGELRNWQTNIYSLAIDPNDPNIIYSGSETGVIFKSINKGITWVSINDNLLPGAVGAIAVSKANSNVVYAFSNVLLLSKDAGVTWSPLVNLPDDYVTKIVINPTTSRVIVAGKTGVYFSTNEGATWTKSTMNATAIPQFYDVILNVANPNDVFAVSANSANDLLIYKSTNGGTSFNLCTIPTGVLCYGARMATTEVAPNTFYCITLNSATPSILKSTDNGTTWATTVNFVTSSWIGTNVINGLGNGQGYYDLAIMVSPQNADHVIVGTSTSFKSTDGGLNFSPLGGYFGPFGRFHPDMQCMVAQGADSYIATDGGINYSTDFFTATSNADVRINGLTGSDFWGFSQGWDEDLVVGGRYHNGNTALYEAYGAGNALRLGGGESATGHVLYGADTKRVAGFNDIGTIQIPQTATGPIINAPISNTLWPNNDYYGYFNGKLMIDPRYSNTYYVGNGNDLWKSENHGKSYLSLKTFSNKVWRYDISRTNPDKIYLITNDGIYKTVDAGVTWLSINLPGSVTFNYYTSDIVVNPEMENEIWCSMSQGSANNKVFHSIDGGATWLNYTGTGAQNKKITYLVPHGGTNGGIYAITNDVPIKILYRDNTMADWVDFSQGMPNNFISKLGGIIFYRDNKLRIAGNRGVFESKLYTEARPLAQPMANFKYVSCDKDTVLFTDHSMLQYQGAKWSWSFPGANYVSSTTVREPKVTYPGPGNYNVTLTVTDYLNQSSTKTVNNMIVFTENNCKIDTLAGKCVSLTGGGSKVNLGKININSDKFSIGFWMRPFGKQKSFSQIIGHEPCPGSAKGFGIGFTFKGYTPNLNLIYTAQNINYWNTSSLNADSTKWNYVVLTYSPTEVKLFLNGVGEVVNSGTMPVINFSTLPFYLNLDVHYQGGDYKGEVDEIKFFNYTLTQNEIREKMHLIYKNISDETGLIGYTQFNKSSILAPNIFYDVVSGTRINLQQVAQSTAPIGLGTVQRIPNVNTAGPIAFTNAGMELEWPTGGTFPNGELVAFHLKNKPDSSLTVFEGIPKEYYIVNNYGANKTFSPLKSIRFLDLAAPQNATFNNFDLYKRQSTSYLKAEWGSVIGSTSNYTPVLGSKMNILFANPNINTFSQFVVPYSNINVPLASIINDFKVKNIENEGLKISWDLEKNNVQNVVLERSENARKFTEIYSITQAGNSQNSYLDKTVSPNIDYYYRLKVIMEGGNEIYSNIIAGKYILNTISIQNVFPNPFENWLNIKLNSKIENNIINLIIATFEGKIVYATTEKLQIGENQIKLNLSNLSEGNYIINANGKGLEFAQKIKKE